MARSDGSPRPRYAAVALAVAVAIVAGCSRSGPDTTSGTRLSHHGWVGGEASAYRRTLDTELDVLCSMATADDGTTRCLPVEPVFLTEWFADERCSAEAVVVGSSDGTYGAVGRYPADPAACGAQVVVADLSPVADSTTVYVQEAGACVPAASTPLGYALAIRRSPADFVEVKRTKRRSSGGLGVEVWEGEDGSQVHAGAWDQRYGSVTVMELAQPAGERLVPAISASPMNYHSDATCETPVFGAPVCDPDSVGVLLEQASPSDPARALRVGQEVPASALFTPADGSAGCRPAEDEGLESFAFFTPGDAFGSDDLEAVRVEVLGDGPVQTRVWTAANGAVLGPAEPPLAHRGEACTPVVGPTASQALCVPGAAPEVSLGLGFFADPACTSRPLIYGGEENANLRPGDAVVERREPVDDVDVFAVWVVQGEYTEPLYWSGPDGCVPGEDIWDGDEPFWVLAAAESGAFPRLDDQPL